MAPEAYVVAKSVVPGQAELLKYDLSRYLYVEVARFQTVALAQKVCTLLLVAEANRD